MDEPLKDFLRSCDDRSLRRDLILGIEWDTGNKPKDGLIAYIEERLIIHGDRKDVDSYHSRKALDSLLRKIADLLSAVDDRSLTYADFCVAFDEATMELMPKGEAAALRSVANQLQPIAKTSLLTPSAQALRVLGNPLPLVRGATLRDQLVAKYASILRHHGTIILRGSTGLGKTSLARMVTDQLGGEWVWACFRGRAPEQIADLLNRAAFEIRTLGLTSQIVIDDLDLDVVARFERELLAIVFTIKNNGGSVVITGPSFCPPNLLNKLWLTEECDQMVPYLNEKDVAAVALLHGLEDTQILQKWSHVIWLTTYGHPQLVHARIRNLQSRNWPPVEEMTWLQGEDLQPERDASRRRLSDEIPSEGARSLAYRLSLMVENFSRELALNLAQLPPPISLAGESFDLLDGPWIERIGEESYRVSPLLLHQGFEVLTLADTKAVHEKIALEILGRKSLSPPDVGTILAHALAARSERALVQLTYAIMTANSDIWKSLGDTVFWFPSIALESGQQIFGENSFIDLMLRLSQYRVAAASKQADKALAIIDRTYEILAKQDEKIAIANTAMAYLVFLLTIEIPIPPRRSVVMLSRLIDISRAEHDFGDMFQGLLDKGNINLSLAGLSPAQTLFTFEAARITGLDDLKELLEALNELDHEKRTYLLAALETSDVTDAELLVGTAWWKDASKDRLDIGKAISILCFAVEVGRAWEAPKLVRAAYVAMSVIRDEYEHAPEAALSIIDEAEGVVGKNDARLLNQRAKVLFHLSQDHASLELFERALEIGALPNVEQMFAARSGGMAAAHTGDWAKAERLFLIGTRVEAQAEDMIRMAIGLLADAAFARWKQGKQVESLALYSEVLTKLESIPIDDNIKNRHLHAVVRQSLLWISHTDDAAEYNIAEPLPGICSNQEPHEGFKNLEIKDMPTIWGMLGSIDTKIGTGLELAKIAKDKYGKLPILIEISQRYSSYQALFKNINTASAINSIVAMDEALMCKKPMEEKKLNGWSASEIPPLPPAYWDSVDNRNKVLNILLSVAITVTCYDFTSQLPLHNWRYDLTANGIKGSEIDHFFDVIGGSSEPEADNLLEDAANCLQRIRKQALSPKDLFIVHFRLLNFLATGEWGNYSAKPFSDLLSRQWQDIAEHQTFALISPKLYVPHLSDICAATDLSGYSKAAAIIEVAALATGVSVSKSGLDFLSQIKERYR